MCWKDELIAACKSIERAESHIKKAHSALLERASKRKATLERAKRSDIKEHAEVLYEKYCLAAENADTAIKYLHVAENYVEHLIQTVTISRKK